MSLSAIVVLAFFLGSIPLSLWKPFYGILAWTVVAFVNPQWYAWGINHQIARSEVIAIPTLIGVLAFTRCWNRLATRECGILFVLWVWFTITALNADLTALFADFASERWLRWRTVSIILIMTAATILTVNSRKRFRMLLLVIGGSFGLFIAKAIPFVIASGGEFRLYGPDFSMLSDNNDFGLALNMTLPVFFFLAQTEESPWLRRIFWGLFMATIPAVFFTYSRGALVGLVVVMLFLLPELKRHRFMIVVAIGMAIAIAIVFAPEKWRDRMETLGDSAEGTLDASAQSRINAWTYSWRLAMDYPVTGGGFEAFTPELFKRYAPNVLDVHGPHSIYFGVLAEHGFVGLGLYFALLSSCFFSTGWIIRHGRAVGDDTAVGYARMLRYSVFGFMASGAFLGRAYFDFFLTIVALITSLRYTVNLEWQVAAEEDSSEEEVGSLAQNG